MFFDIELSSILFQYVVCEEEVKTTPEIVMKASGLHYEAIRAIARENGVLVKSERSRCIDENLLSLLADAHVRQLKSFFNKSNRHISELSGAEFVTFMDFCETFKKHHANTSSLTWNDIDVDSIREEFINEVHESTPGYVCRRDKDPEDKVAVIPINHSPYTGMSYKSFKKRRLIAEALACYRQIRSIIFGNHLGMPGADVILWVTKSFRFHIFSSPGNDDHLNMCFSAI